MTTPPATAVPALGNTPAAPMNPSSQRVDEFADYPRDQWKRPLIAVPGPDGKPRPNPIVGMTDAKGTPIPWVSEPHIRASTAGSALEHEGGINSWKIRQAVIGFMARPDLFALAQTVTDPGGAGRSELDDRIEAAQEAAGSGAAANQGTAGHAFAEKHDRGQALPALDEPFRSWLAAYVHLTRGWTWEHIEARLVCSELRMAGRTDRIGRPAGYMIAPDGQIIGPDDRVVVDLKTSSSSKYFGVKFAVQLAVYGHGDLYDPATGLLTPTGARRDWALVLHIPSGGSSGSWWWVNISVGYELAELANDVLTARKRKDVVAQVGEVYATLDEALAAGGVLLDANYVAPQFTPAPAAEDVPEPADGACSACNLAHPPALPCPEPYLADLGRLSGAPTAEPAPHRTYSTISAAEVCEIHGPHGGTVDCVECLEEWRTWRSRTGLGGFVGPGDSFESWHAGRLQLIADGHPDPYQVAAEAEITGESELQVEARLGYDGRAADGTPAPGGGVPDEPVSNGPARPEPSDPTTWPADLGRKLQAAHEARQDPAAQLARELAAVRTAPPRGGLEAVRQRFALSWSAEHQAAFERRGWELGILAALERSTTVDNLVAVHGLCVGWSAWTDEMDRVASRRATEIAQGDG